MNLIERYLGRVLVSYTLIVLMVLLIILGFSEFMIQLGKLNDSYTLAKGTFYTLLKLPVYAYEIFPVALLIGTLLGLGGLANHSELTILRVTGWPIRRIFWGVMKSAMILWFVVAVMGEWIAPHAEAYAKKMRSEALSQSFSIGSSADFWMKDEDVFVHVGKVISERQFFDVSLYKVKDDRLESRIFAQKANYLAGTEHQWELINVTESSLGWQYRKLPLPNIYPDKKNWQKLIYEQKHMHSMQVSLPVNPELLQSLHVDTRYMGIVDLYRYIDFLEKNDLDAEPYRLAFWRKIAMPLVIISMVSLVFPLIFGSQRQVSMGQRVFVGILVGMGFHLLNQIFGNLSVVYHISAILGAFLPAVTLFVLSLFLMRRLR
ncbi:LPS export ABC transporter permease LptG [Hydrogenovibrio kuenenii]|uniref:LPS export ABC transporter permease LptG n=1 Tax=Hydrogenovibrio kuenenii TaxID=63658 RepID=UPI0004665C76|nr:LPS export ABC transporter permease LptG [Hydrogenovibrio kuenenii]